MNERSHRVFSLKRLAALIPGLAVLAGCGKAHQDRVAAPPELPCAVVQTRIAETKVMPAFEEVVGTVSARLRAAVEAKTSGRIIEFPVVLGQKVQNSQLLARLDAPEIKARLEQAQASLQQAERDWKRMSSLYDQQAATRSDYETAESRLQLTKAGVAEARALLDYIEVKAPFDGVVTRKSADIGDLATPGKPLLELEDPTRLQLEADIPEDIAAGIQSGARLSVRPGQSPTGLFAIVSEIAPNADPVSRTFRVKLDLPPNPSLKSGQFARLAVPVGQTASMRVPASAVVQRGQMELVFAVENRRARLHLVKTGRQFKDETEILSGLESGDAVVVDIAGQLVDGQPVTSQ